MTATEGKRHYQMNSRCFKRRPIISALFKIQMYVKKFTEMNSCSTHPRLEGERKFRRRVITSSTKSLIRSFDVLFLE